MAKRFARQEHLRTFQTACNETPQWPPCPTHQLFRLELLQGERMSTAHEGVADSEDDNLERKSLAYDHIFSGLQIGEKPVRILVEGGAGTGKTALCMLLFKGWENGEFFHNIELLLLLPLRQAKVTKARSISQLIKTLFPSRNSDVISYLQRTKGEKVLIVADGFSELAETEFLHNLLLCGLLSQASVLITSRPSASASLHKTNCSIDYFMEIYGFSDSTICQYIRAKFAGDQQKAIGLLDQLESNRLIQEVCRIPLNCAVVFFLWQNNQDLGLFSTTTGFLTDIILNFVYRNMLKNDAYSSHPRLLNIHSLPENLHNPWRVVCEIAFQTIWFRPGVNPQIELTAQPGLEILGVLEFIDKVTFNFVHPTFQEFFAALYLVMQPLKKQLEVFELHTKSKHLTLFYRLFFGLYFHNYNSASMAGVLRIMCALSQSYAANNDEHLLCHYALEAKNNDVTKGMIGILINRTTKTINFGHPSTAFDCHAVMYIIANIQELTFVEIDFHDCHLGDKWICDELVPVLSKKAMIVKVKILNLINNNLTDSGIVDIFSEETSSAFRYLAKLFLRDNRLGEQSVRAIKATLAKSSCSMNLLDLSNNPLSAGGIKELQSAMESNNLKKLEILFLRGTLPTDNASNNVTCLNAFAIAVSTCCPRLRRLDLSAIDLGEPGNEAICILVLHFTGTRTNFDLQLNREYMPEVDKKFMAVMEDCIKNKGTIDHTVVHGIIVGPGRSGKDSLMNRLLGKAPQDKDYLSASTGVLESVVKVEVKKLCCTTVAAAANNLIWRRLDYNEEALELMMSTAKHCSVAHDRKLHTLNQCKGNDSCKISQNYESYVKPPECSEGKLVRSNSLRVKPKVHYLDEYLHDSEDGLHETSMLHSQANLINQVLVVPVQDKWPGVTDVLKSAVESRRMDDLREHLESSWSLYLTNTGGQMEFQELLPLLVCGPSAFFVTFPLNKDLMDHYTVLYHHNDANRTEETYPSPSTLMDEILQTLATINALDLTGHQQDNQPKPKVFLIGTHKDKLPDHLVEKRIHEIDQQLQEKIRQTSLFRQGSIEFAEGKKRLIFTVNNLAKDDTDFQKIRCALQQAIDRTDQFTIKCPSTWLIFSLALRAKHKSSQILTYDECFTFAQGCGISDRKELSDALFFIHTRLGLVRYFNVKELNKRVIIDPQILFDKITDLIIKTFVFDNADVNEVEKFQNQGIFSVKTMERICKKRHRFESDPQLPFKWLLKLLSHLRIAAVFKDKDGTFKCFFPAVLCHAPAQQQIPLKHSDSPQHDSLLVAFEGGFCPRGIPSALITYLMTNEMDSEFSWDLLPRRVFKNQVCFSIESCGDIILKIHSTYLQLYLDPETEINDENELKLTLGEVYKCIEQGMKTITKGYKNCNHFFAFHCTMHGCKKYAHPAKITWRDDRPVKLKCMVTSKQYSLPDHCVWDLRRVNYTEVQVPKQKLDLPLDSYNQGVPQHLGKIADSIPQWEGAIAEALELTQVDVEAIKAKHPNKLDLQTRLALEKWKQSKGDKATYGQLIAVLEGAGYQGYADSVRKVANSIEIPTNDNEECHQSSPLVPSPTEVESLFLTNSPDDNQNKQKDIVHITENSANELQKVIDEELDIPLSSEPNANTASVVMKPNLKEQSSFKETIESDESDDNTSSSTRIENTDEKELSITDPLTGLSRDMTSGSTADASEDPQRQTSISSPGVQQTQQQSQIVENMDGESGVTLHANLPPTTSQMDELGASQPEQTLKQQKEQQQPTQQLPQQQQLQGQQMGGASQLLGGASKQMGGASQQQQQQSQQQTVQGAQQPQQQPQQQARPMVVWNGIMEFTEVQDNKRQMRQVQCNVLTATSDVVRELQPNQWPQRMNMNTYPKVLFNSIAQMMNFQSGNVKAVTFQFLENPQNVAMLRMLISPKLTTFAIVQLVGVQQSSQCPIRALLLVWNDRSSCFTGLVPLEQDKFINVLKQVLSDAQRQRIMKLQQQQQQQQQQKQAQQAQQGQLPGMQDQQQVQGQMGGVSQPGQPAAQQHQQGQSTQQGQQAAGGMMGQPPPPQGGQQQMDMRMAQVQQFIRSLAFANPRQQEQLLQRVPPQRRAQVLMRAQQIRQQEQQQQHQQQNVGGMGIGQGQGGMGQSLPGMNVLPGQQPMASMAASASPVSGMQQPPISLSTTPTAQVIASSISGGGNVGQGGGVTMTTQGGGVVGRNLGSIPTAAGGTGSAGNPIQIGSPITGPSMTFPTTSLTQQTAAASTTSSSSIASGQFSTSQQQVGSVSSQHRGQLQQATAGNLPSSSIQQQQQPQALASSVAQNNLVTATSGLGNPMGSMGSLQQQQQQQQPQQGAGAGAGGMSSRFGTMAPKVASMTSSPYQQQGGIPPQQQQQQQQSQTNLNVAKKYAEMAKQAAEMRTSGPRAGPIGLQQPAARSMMPGMVAQQQQQPQQPNVGGMGIGQGQGGMGQSQPGMNVLRGQQPQQQHQMGGPGNVASSSVGSVQQGGGRVTVTASGGQVDTQLPLNSGVQQPDGVMTGAGHGMGMAGGATATSGGTAPMNLMTPERWGLEQVRAQQTAAMQQMAAGGASYPAGAAQGQQYATRPPPGPTQANPPMTIRQVMPAPQWAQYVQQPPSGPGVMMPSAPRPPIGYQFGMNPNMSGQPPTATGGYPAGAAQIQQYYGMRPPPGPMQLANPPMTTRQAMQAPQSAPQYQPSRPME